MMPRGGASPTRACKDGRQSSRTPCMMRLTSSTYASSRLTSGGSLEAVAMWSIRVRLVGLLGLAFGPKSQKLNQRGCFWSSQPTAAFPQLTAHNSFFPQPQLNQSHPKSPGCFQSLLFCLWNPMFAHKIGSRIKELNKRLESIHNEADKYKFNIGLGSNLEPRKLTAAELSSYRTSSQVDESAIVGEQIEKDTRELVQVLTTDDDNNHNIKVMSIIGAGGMGKTTLAQKIFNDTSIQEHFMTKTIWLSITQQFDEVELLRTAIKHAGGDHGAETDKNTVTETLFHTLSSGRFLLVMDDVWSQKVWNDVLSVPVRNASKKQPGSRVLVTTRSAHLPQLMQAPLHQHRVNPLENDDAWSLLKKQLQPDQEKKTHRTLYRLPWAGRRLEL
ncbi:putative disease resistance protein RGA3 [Miscanthus floridulus]|uniref:putative disease resistance protein RGA3 n=1 Tax=Miscanthus floridulus TaxID=154761 RepID=UPI003458563E